MSTVIASSPFRRPRWLVLGFAGWVIVELLALWGVAHLIGWGWALLALIVVSLAGLSLVRRQFVRSWREMRAGGVATRVGDEVVVSPVDPEHLARGSVGVAAGLLLTLPGFVSAVLGALLLLPVLRRRLGARLARSVIGRSAAPAAVPHRGAGRDAGPGG